MSVISRRTAAWQSWNTPLNIVGLSVNVIVQSSVTLGVTRRGASMDSRPFAVDNLIVHLSPERGIGPLRGESDTHPARRRQA